MLHALYKDNTESSLECVITGCFPMVLFKYYTLDLYIHGCPGSTA